MKVYQFESGTGLDALSLVEKPEPQPTYGQVVIRVYVTALNYRDLVVAQGAYAPAVKIPINSHV